MAIQFRKAERKKAKLRLGISGASGSGKTFTALKVAFGLGGGVAVIDTENGSADLYAHLGDFDVLQLQAPYTPEKFTEAIRAAEAAGYATVIIDSLSHAWSGEGGVLEIKDNIGSSFQAWKTVTPRHNALVEALLQSKCHIIATMRAKAEYVVADNDKGKAAPKKVGLAPIQREGMEYEFTVFLDLSAEHVATASKDRTGLIDGNPVKNPDERLGQRLLAWLEDGADAPEPTQPAPKFTPAAPAPEQDYSGDDAWMNANAWLHDVATECAEGATPEGVKAAVLGIVQDKGKVSALSAMAPARIEKLGDYIKANTVWFRGEALKLGGIQKRGAKVGS